MISHFCIISGILHLLKIPCLLSVVSIVVNIGCPLEYSFKDKDFKPHEKDYQSLWGLFYRFSLNSHTFAYNNDRNFKFRLKVKYSKINVHIEFQQDEANQI